MIFPAIKLHQLYSLNLYDGLDIIFEDLSMLNSESLKEVLTTKKYSNINLVNNALSINTNKKTITIVGHKINNSTFIVNREGRGDITICNYNCSDETIISGIEYLYHMYKNLV
jgi:hypothetical protein